MSDSSGAEKDNKEMKVPTARPEYEGLRIRGPPEYDVRASAALPREPWGGGERGVREGLLTQYQSIKSINSQISF